MALLERLSGAFERMNKKSGKSKDLTPGKVGQEGILRGGKMKGGEDRDWVKAPKWGVWFIGRTLAALIALIALLALGVGVGIAAIAVEDVDWADVKHGDATPHTITLSVDCAGTNRLLLIGISNYPRQCNVSGVTVNGSSTGVDRLDGDSPANDMYQNEGANDAEVYIYKKAAPATGTNTVVISFDANFTDSGALAGAICFSGVDQTTPLGIWVSAPGDSAGPAQVTVSSATDELVFSVLALEGGNDTVSSNGDTEPWKFYHTTTNSDEVGAACTKAGASSVQISWTLNTNNHWAVGAVPIKPATTTTIGDGTDPSDSTVAPGSTDQYLDQFTFVASTGTDSVTALTVTTANTTAIASMEIWDDTFSTQYFATVSSPAGNDWSFSGGTAIPVTTSSASFRVRFTAKDHATLAAGTYAVTGTVTSYTCTNSQAGTDTDSATITVDNTPPADATWGTITPGDTQIELNWTNPGADFNKVVILRRAGAAVGDAPTNGTEYNVNDTIGSSTVRYVGSLETFTDTGLTNGTAYYYKIFAYDDYINYATGAGTGPHTPNTPLKTIYYSVGTSTANLRSSDTLTVDISSGTATFSEDQADNVGVGDKIDCDTDNKIAYISGRTSAKVYSVITATGGTPGNVTGVDVNSIKRTFNSLSDAVDLSNEAGYLNTQNLVTGNYQLNWPCYNDGVDTSSYVRIEEPPDDQGYTTGANNYIRIYTPTDTSEVGTSQRHNGTAGTGYRIVPSTSTPDSHYNFIFVSNDEGYVRVEGIEIDGSNVTNGEHVRGISVDDSTGTAEDIRISHNLIHDITNSDGTGDESDVNGIILTVTNNTKIFNNIIYNITNVCTNAASNPKGIESKTSGKTHYVYNNTVYNIKNTGNAVADAKGIYDSAGSTLIAKNNYVGKVDSTLGSNEECFSGTFSTEDYNVSSDNTATGPNSQTGKSDYAAYFVDTTEGDEDLHLKDNSNSLWGSFGDDLDQDPNLPVTDDIDGYARDSSQPDIGADEAPSAVLTGTLSDNATEAQIVAGGETLIITLTGEIWDVTIGGNNSKTTDLISGIDSGGSEANGWDAVVKANMDFNDVTRTSDTVVTITLGAEATYDITANETITVTVPTTAVNGTALIVATPTFDITAESGVTTNYRSIGTDTTTLYSAGTASICSGDTVVNFSSGASLPVPTAVGAVGLGDKLTIGSETFYILSRDSATQVTVQSAATADHETESYTIERAYTDIQTWENAHDGLLVSENRREVGVCYKDGAFSLTTGVTFNDSTTDSDHYMHLTVAEGQRHKGRPGTGVVVDVVGITSGSAEKNAFKVVDQYLRIEWLEIKNLDGTTNLGGQPINLDEGDAGNNLLAHLMIHDYTSNGKGAINVYETATVRNSIFYKGDKGIRTYSNDNLILTLENVTIYNMTGTGVDHDKGKLIVKNTISVGSGNNRDFNLANDDPVDGSSGYNMYGTVKDDIHPGASSGLVSVSFDGPTKTITRSTGSFLTDGFVIGNTIRTDSGTNPGPFTISNVTALVITVSEAVTTQAASSRNVYLDVTSVNKRTPPADLDDLFYSITAGFEDLHIHSSGHLALNEGQDLSGSFTDDIDGETRPTGANTWDIGADEHSTPGTGIYVDGNLGNDSNAGTWDAPYATVSQAESVASAGDTIYIRGGITYSTTELYVNVSGTSDNPITFQKWPGPESNPLISAVSVGEGGDDAVAIAAHYIIFDSIDATSAADDGYQISGNHVTIQNCSLYGSADEGISIKEPASGSTIDNCKIYNNHGRGIQLEANANALTVKNCEIYGNESYAGICIITTSAETFLIENNIIHDHADTSDGYGIRLSCNGATVRYNKIYGNYLDNIYVDGNSHIIHHNLLYNSTNSHGLRIYGGSNNIVYNNTIDGNNSDGIRLATTGSGNTIINNIISNNGSYGISDNAGTNEPDDTYNCVYNNTTANFYNLDPASGGTGTITSDPLYVDRNGADDTLGTADDDLHLQSTYGYFPFASGCVESASDSPCIDAGAPSGDYSAYSNEPENNGDQVNMGVYGNTTAASLSGAATAIGLLSFTATGDGASVLVAWETAQEINNMGFYLYRSTSRGGPYTRLTPKLIPGLFSSVLGKEYTYEDTDVTRGKLYYYKLEDLDVHGISTFHGPICVDWDADGLPDDWEIAHGLNPGVNDAYLDSDFDGLTNLEEYELGTDPLNPDTDGDGILDGDEAWRRDRDTTTRTLTKGVEILAADESGVTLELTTDAFDMEIVEREGEAYERLRILDYIHGYIPDVGKPELPLKGILLDIPSGKSATLTVEDVEAETYSGYWIYPVPENVGYDDGAMAHVGEVFAIDEACYSTDAFYPDVIAAMGTTYTFRDQQKLQVFFYPLAFNPVTRELKHYTRIRVRVTFEDAGESALMGNSLLGAMAGPPGPSAAVWSPPSEDPADPAYKVLVTDEGIYRLTKTFFTDNDIDVGGMDLSQVRVYNLDNVTEEVKEVAVYVYNYVHDPHIPGAFDESDYIEFYGQPVADSYAKYTKHNVYWLTISGGIGSPKGMGTIVGTPAGGTLATGHTDTVTHELDQRYWIGAPGDDSLDRWFFNSLVVGDQIGGGGDPVDFNFSIPGVVGQGSLTISLSGFYDTDHEVSVSLNGNPVGTLTWSGITAYEDTISSVTLQDGNNTVTLRCESGLDIVYVDKFVVTYPRSFAVSNDELIFTHDAGHHYQVTGFTTSDLMAFDITFPGEVKRVEKENLQISDPPGPYTLDCEPQSEAEVPTYYVLSTDRVKTPAGITQDVASNLSDPPNGADYILITHRDLGWDGNGDPHPWLTSIVSPGIVDHREAQGLRVKVVDVEDIYDEFSYGMVTPQAIKDFISHAYSSWPAPAPQYVLLVGDSNFDCKDNLGQGNINFVPAYLTYTEYMGEAPTDEWFVKVSGDDAIPDLYIGRLPAKSADEATLMVGKIITYENAVNTKTWEKNVLLVADNETVGNDYEADFELMSEDVAALIPTGMSEPFKGYLNDYLAGSDLTKYIKDKINRDEEQDEIDDNEGALIVNYSGHGSTQIWAGEVLFDTDDVPDLTNDDELVFMVNMTCMTGYFAYPELGSLNLPSLMEGVLRSEGKGAVAAFMPTGMTTTTGQRILDSALFEAIFTDDIRALGPAISQAKQTLLANGSHYEEVSETFLLFGDPAMKLKIPVPRRPTGVSLQSTSQGIIVSWNAATDCKGEPVSGYNVYRSTSAGGAYEKINTVLVTETEYTDTTAVSGTRYYYVIRSVDWEDDESAQTLQLSALAGIGTGSGSSGGSSGPCFISTAAGEIW